jgi:hypothetical protein
MPRKKKENPLILWDRPPAGQKPASEGCAELPPPRKRGRPRKKPDPALAWKPPTGRELRELEEDWDQTT